jgi:DNA repair protein RadA/Sms
VRPVANGEQRITEAAKHGFRQAIVPHANQPKKVPSGMVIHGVKSLRAALDVLDTM